MEERGEKACHAHRSEPQIEAEQVLNNTNRQIRGRLAATRKTKDIIVNPEQQAHTLNTMSHAHQCDHSRGGDTEAGPQRPQIGRTGTEPTHQHGKVTAGKRTHMTATPHTLKVQ